MQWKPGPRPGALLRPPDTASPSHGLEALGPDTPHPHAHRQPGPQVNARGKQTVKDTDLTLSGFPIPRAHAPAPGNFRPVHALPHLAAQKTRRRMISGLVWVPGDR